MKKVIVSFAMLLISALCYTSCSSGNGSMRPFMVRTWSLEQYGIDKNGNGQWDTSERYNASSTGMSQTLILKDDGTGSEHLVYTGYQDTTYPIKWDLSIDNYLTISGGGYTFSEYLQSVNLNSMTLRLTDTSYGTITTAWSEYSRQ